eukprot:TRINITY_DN27211_c0_g1_i1.p1 TRINITY_DN27211_c0_g1~~TRINITY_DN27211_c0_g1_i1.p1  ORF type:complete len:446 (+),score=97.12 TRINITY_DN27211_c0_g1_i1:96-1433(+)
MAVVSAPPSRRRLATSGRNSISSITTFALLACGLWVTSTGLLAWLAPRQSPTTSSLRASTQGRSASSRIILNARGGGEDFRAYANSLPVDAGYTGPQYAGPSSVNDAFIDGLLQLYKQQGKLPMKYVYQMTLDVQDILKNEKSLQRIPVPSGSKITVVGDLHGQYFDFVHMIEQVSGKPNPSNPMLFNGDFVDRGPWSVEVLMCLFAFKLQNPTAVHFNRGNHESEMTNYQYGFSGEVEVKYEKKLMELFSETFRYLPLASVLEGQVFVAHAGLPGPEERLWEEWMQKAPDEAAGVLKRDNQVTLAQIEAVNRNVEPNPMEAPLMIDFLWSDPKGANGYGPSTRVPMVYTFGPDVADRFLQANGLKYMLRSHETKSAGHQETVKNVYTVFSAPNYIDKAGNMAAVAVVTNKGGSLEPEFKQFTHQPHPDIESGAYMPGKSLAPKK